MARSQFIKEQDERAITYALLLGVSIEDRGPMLHNVWLRFVARYEDVEASVIGRGATRAAAARDWLRRNGYNLNRDGSLTEKATPNDANSEVVGYTGGAARWDSAP